VVDNSFIAMGDAYVVRYMRFQNAFPAQDFIRSSDRLPGEHSKFLAQAGIMARFGRLPTTTHGHWLQGDYCVLYEFKPGSARLFAFQHLHNLYVVSGAPKRKPKAQNADFDHAMHLRQDFLDNLP
jgi:hypothetical protein